MCHHAKFHQNWWNVCKDIVKDWIFHLFGTKTIICTFFRCFGVNNSRKLKIGIFSEFSLLWHENRYLRYFRCFRVKNSRKLKLSALSSLYECTNLELKLHWLICIVAANFIKKNRWINCWDIAFDIFLNGSIHHLKFFKIWLSEQLLCAG